LEAIRKADARLREAETTPGKNPSEGPRKAISPQEDAVQEDKERDSRSARTREKAEGHAAAIGAPTPLLRPNSGIAHSPKPGMSSVGELLQRRPPMFPSTP